MSDSTRTLAAGMFFCSRSPAAALCTLLLAWGCSAGVVGRPGGSVDLPCALQNLSHPIEEIRVYWQRQDVVVATVVDGKVDTSLQDERYRGRAHLDPLRVRRGDFTLHLSNLSDQDSGTYLCVILWMPSVTITLRETEVALNVTGDMSPPDAAGPVLVQAVYGWEHNLTCTSPMGFRVTGIMWINAGDGTVLQEGRIHNQQDGDRGHVTSTISINATSPINITCMIMTEQRNITRTYKMAVSGNPQEEKHGGITVPIVATFAVIIPLVAGTVLFIRKILSSKHPEQRAQYQPAHESCQIMDG